MRAKPMVLVLWFGLPVALMFAALGLYFWRGGELIDNRGKDFLTLFVPPCRDPYDCADPSPELLAAFPGDDTCSDGATEYRRLCVVVVGDVPAALVLYLTDYYQREYGLTLHIARPISLNDLDLPYTRRNFEATAFRKAVEERHPLPFSNEANRVIVLTSIELTRGVGAYADPSATLAWAFSRQFIGDLPAEDEYRSSALSTYRLDPRANGKLYDRRLHFQRVRKLLDRYVALTYFDLQKSFDPFDVTYQHLYATDDLDHATNIAPWKVIADPTPRPFTPN